MKNIIVFFSDKKILLFAIPVFFIVFAFITTSEVNLYHTWMIDPEYGYLMNGLNLAQPSLVIGFTDNPGTTVQILCALIIRVVHFFIGQESLINDVLKNPELYISTTVCVLQIINTILLFFLGSIIYKTTGKMYFALFLQLTPLATQMSVYTIDRLNPEQLTISIVMIFIMRFFLYLYPDSGKKRVNEFTHILWFAILMGLAIATKLTLLSLAFIPLFLLNGYKNRIIYIGISLICVFLCLTPVILNGSGFFNWVIGLISHTGKYGSGENKIFDLNLFISNLKLIFTRDTLFNVVFILSIIIIGIYFIPKLKIKEKNDKFFRLLLGIFVTFLVQIFLVAKHFGYNYLLSIQLLSLLLIFLLIILLSRKFSWLQSDKIRTVFVFIFVFSFLFYNIKNLWSARPYIKARIENNTETMRFIQEHIGAMPTIIVPAAFTAAYPEWGLKWGQYYSGDMYKIYASCFDTIYPGKYILSKDDGKLMGWYGSVSFLEIISKYKTMYLYFGDKADDFKRKFFDEISQNVNIENIYTNKNTEETIYKIYLSANSLFNHPVKSIYLKAFNNKYVSDDAGRGNVVVADKDKAQSWEAFNMILLDSNKILFSTFENKYMSADISSDGAVTAFRTKANLWETFTLENLDNNRVAFKAANGNYLTVDNNTLQLIAKSHSIGDREKFELIFIQSIK